MATTSTSRKAVVGLAVTAAFSTGFINPGLGLVAGLLALKTVTDTRRPKHPIFLVPRN
jgi:hypothetical protein